MNKLTFKVPYIFNRREWKWNITAHNSSVVAYLEKDCIQELISIIFIKFIRKTYLSGTSAFILAS